MSDAVDAGNGQLRKILHHGDAGETILKPDCGPAA
jgi:hypothetical protein